MNAETSPLPKKTGSPDFALLLQQIEKRLLTGSQTEQAVQILGRESIWKTLPPDQALRWARLAQVAGLPDLSLQVLSWVTQNEPGCVEAWQQRVDLLETLGRKQASPEAAACAVRSENADASRPSPGTPSRDDWAPWEEVIETPFASMR